MRTGWKVENNKITISFTPESDGDRMACAYFEGLVGAACVITEYNKVIATNITFQRPPPPPEPPPSVKNSDPKLEEIGARKAFRLLKSSLPEVVQNLGEDLFIQSWRNCAVRDL